MGTDVELSTNAGIRISLTSLFYDCSGADISVGVAGKMEGEAKAGVLSSSNELIEGKMILSLYPYLQGGIIIKVPVIDNQLAELSLFELELKPFWEKVWNTEINTTTNFTDPVISIESIITNFQGVDWVLQDNFSEEIGTNIISGTGKKYTVISRENNFDSGGSRTRVVLMSEDKQKMMIGNLPNFHIDEATGNIYFVIHEYYSDPNYKEY